MANALNEHEWDYLIRPLLVYDAQVLDPSEDAPGSPNTVRGQGPPGGPPYDYPVVHGTLGGMFYFYMALLLAFGKSAPAIKAAYAALHTLSVVMIYAIARAVEPDARKKAMTGLAAALIAVSAPFFNKDPFVSANPEEVVSLALFLPVVWLYVKRGVATSGIVYGFLCFVVTAVKVYPGILLAGLLGMDALRRIIFSRERRVERWLFHFVTVWLAASTVQAMRTNAFPLLEYWFLEKSLHPYVNPAATITQRVYQMAAAAMNYNSPFLVLDTLARHYFHDILHFLAVNALFAAAWWTNIKIVRVFIGFAATGLAVCALSYFRIHDDETAALFLYFMFPFVAVAAAVAFTRLTVWLRQRKDVWGRAAPTFLSLAALVSITHSFAQTVSHIALAPAPPYAEFSDYLGKRSLQHRKHIYIVMPREDRAFGALESMIHFHFVGRHKSEFTPYRRINAAGDCDETVRDWAGEARSAGYPRGLYVYLGSVDRARALKLHNQKLHWGVFDQGDGDDGWIYGYSFRRFRDDDPYPDRPVVIESCLIDVSSDQGS